ncbi:MAG: UTP--glucose-1-phosphate uridylyltransferase GalU [Dehalococcoidia bacterium]|nr:UTP--glucose-1-phosphate uridylyltransferase GalU [Dehalococcoidia bacterium]
MKVRKAVITAAGWGTRFLPATKVQPKEMLPLVDRPALQYIIEEIAASGIEHVVIVTASGKQAIENHFDRSFELEHFLKQKGHSQLLHEIQAISQLADICYVRQSEQLGLGHAVLITERCVGNEPFALFLPDDIIRADVPAIKQLLDVYDRYGCSVVAVEPVARHDTASYGIIEPEHVEERIFRVLGLVEKPEPEKAPSNLGIVGRYILTPEIFAMLRKTPPGKGGEIQLTDGLRLLLDDEPVFACAFQGRRFDTGTPLGLLLASLEMALDRPDLRDNLMAYLRSLELYSK